MLFCLDLVEIEIVVAHHLVMKVDGDVIVMTGDPRPEMTGTDRHPGNQREHGAAVDPGKINSHCMLHELMIRWR